MNADAELSLTDRLSDRVNPILVREIQQALHGKVFMLTLFASVLAIVGLATGVAIENRMDMSMGRDAFATCVTLLAPVVIFIVPFQAFLSMRHEVTGGTAEQLLLTKLSPLRIVLGKLGAASLQFVMYFGIFAPTLALTFLLRGVDVPTILFFLWFGVLSSIAMTVFAIALGAASRVRFLGNPLTVATTAGLVGATALCMAAAWEGLRDIAQILNDSDVWQIIAGMTAAYLIGIALLVMIAASMLAHSYENRSSQFRIFAFAVLAIAALGFGIAVPSSYLDEVGPGFAAVSAACLLPFWLWAVCEDDQLSPRVREHVPAKRWQAWLLVPLLPGGNRGLMFLWLLAASALACGLGMTFIRGVDPDPTVLTIAVLSWAYVIGYATIGRAIRRRLRPGLIWTMVSMTAVILVLGALCVGPALAEFLISGQPPRAWTPLQVMNPFWTLDDLSRGNAGHGPLIGGGAAIVVLLAVSFRWFVPGTREILNASAARRARAG